MSGPRRLPDEVFDLVAPEYDRVRPGYPESVIDRIVAYAELGGDSRLLELGAGTGKATLPMARRGFSIVGLEPGEVLVQLAQNSLAEFPNVELHCTTFEQWNAPSAAFDLVFAAQSYHWLERNRRLARIAFTLGRPGTLAVFGNSATTAGDPLHEGVRAAYTEHAPSLWERADVRAWYGAVDSPVVEELLQSRLFRDVRNELFHWRRSLTSTDFCALLSTYSDHSTLPRTRLDCLLRAVGDAVRAGGDVITLDYCTALFLARAI